MGSNLSVYLKHNLYFPPKKTRVFINRFRYCMAAIELLWFTIYYIVWVILNDLSSFFQVRSSDSLRRHSSIYHLYVVYIAHFKFMDAFVPWTVHYIFIWKFVVFHVLAYRIWRYSIIWYYVLWLLIKFSIRSINCKKKQIDFNFSIVKLVWTNF